MSDEKMFDIIAYNRMNDERNAELAQRQIDFMANHPPRRKVAPPNPQLLKVLRAAIDDHKLALDAFHSYMRYMADTDDKDIDAYVTVTDDVYETALQMQIATENLILAI